MTLQNVSKQFLRYGHDEDFSHQGNEDLASDAPLAAPRKNRGFARVVELGQRFGTRPPASLQRLTVRFVSANSGCAFRWNDQEAVRAETASRVFSAFLRASPLTMVQ